MLVDTHCHLTSPGLVERVDEVLAAANAAGVRRVIVVTVNIADAHAAVELLLDRPQLYWAAGIHPHEAGTSVPAQLDELLALLGDDGPAARVRGRLVALGETGLDFFYDFASPERQEALFRRHLEMAVGLNLPVVLHARDSEARVCDILAEYPALRDRFVFHCFSGGPELAARIMALGGYLSFTGVVTFRKNADTIQAAARAVPADRFFVETDAPYLSPEPVRHVRPNEPAHVIHTARCLAKLRGAPFEQLVQATTVNAQRFFGLREEHA